MEQLGEFPPAVSCICLSDRSKIVDTVLFYYNSCKMMFGTVYDIYTKS